MTDWEAATGAESFERLMWKEIQAKNWREVEPRLAMTFVSVSPGGRHDREASLKALRHLDLETYSLGEFQVNPAGQASVVTYTAVVRGTLHGAPLPSSTLRLMTVWQQIGRDWVAIAHSHSLVNDTSETSKEVTLPNL